MRTGRLRRLGIFTAAISIVPIWATMASAPALAVTPASAWYSASTEGPITSDLATFSSPAPGQSPYSIVSAIGPNIGNWVYLEGADTTPIAVGTYSDARDTITPGHPLLNPAIGCSTGGTGWFVVHEVSFSGDGSLTMLAVDYRIECNDHSYLREEAVRFNSNWPVKALQPVGNHVDLGNVVTGSSARFTSTLRSVGTVPFTVSSIDITGAGAGAWSIDMDACTGNTIAPGDTCTYDVVAAPTTSGEFEAGAVVNSDAITPSVRTTRLLVHGLIATTATVETLPSQVDTGSVFHIRGTVSPTPDGGRIDFTLDGMWAGSPQLAGGNSMDVWAGPLAVGAHTMRAQFVGTQGTYANSDSGTITFFVGDVTTTTIATSRSTVYEGQAATLTATVAGPAGLTGGTLTITDFTTSTVLGSIPVTTTARSFHVAPALAVGDHLIVAAYTGTTDFTGSQSSIGVTVLPDSGVALTKVTVTPTTFYPYHDGYRDTASIGGTLDEPATVSIAIYSSSGHRVALVSLGTKTGVYAYRWTGKSSSGAILASGRYRAVQTLRDTTGHTLVKASFVTISAKRLYWHTVTVTKTASQYTKRAPSWIGWTFSVPSATVYKSMVLSVYGVTGVPPAQFGAWNYAICGYYATWGPSCILHAGYLPMTTGWVSKSLSVTNERYAHTVRAFVYANSYGSVGKVSTVRLKVTYGVLK